jgi:hypothetical protein
MSSSSLLVTNDDKLFFIGRKITGMNPKIEANRSLSAELYTL